MSPAFTIFLTLVGIGLVECLNRQPGCGRSKYSDAGQITSYIIGGDYARHNEFPWQVTLRWAGADHLWAHTCNGALVERDWIVTNVECVYSVPVHSMVAVVGSVNIFETDDSNPARQELQIEDWFWYEGVAKDQYLDSTIALIKLKHPAELNENVQLACYPDAGEDYAGYDGIIAGWGEQHEFEGDYSPDLKFLHMPIMSSKECKKYDWGLTKNMLCAGGKGLMEAPCGGDNGAPLMVQRGDQWEVAGILSHSNGCAHGYPTIYVRVTEFLDWMEMIMTSYPNIPNYP